VISAVHGMLVVVRRRFVDVDDFLRVDGEVLKVGEEGFLECVAVYNAWVNLEEKPNDFGVVMAKVIGFNEDLMVGEPIEESEVVDGGVFEFGDREGAAENAADRKLVLKCGVVGAVV